MPRWLLFAALALPLSAQNPVTDALRSSYNRMRLNLVESAQAVPEADFAFRLTPAQRPFGEWLSHTAMSAYTACASMKGNPAPPEAAATHNLEGKAAISKAIEDSFHYCDSVLNEMTDARLAAEVQVGDRKLYPACLLYTSRCV